MDTNHKTAIRGQRNRHRNKSKNWPLTFVYTSIYIVNWARTRDKIYINIMYTCTCIYKRCTQCHKLSATDEHKRFTKTCKLEQMSLEFIFRVRGVDCLILSGKLFQSYIAAAQIA